MKVAAITITFNRLELTKQTVESFYSKTDVDYHLFIDNGSTDGSQQWIEQNYDHIFLEKNEGIAYAFIAAFNSLPAKYDFILKLDNDIEVVTDNIINKMLGFYWNNANKFVASPTDLLLDKNFAPRSQGKIRMNGYNIEYVTHTGGAFQLIPYDACKKLCDDFRHFARGDYAIGEFYRRINYRPVYLRDCEIKHIGLNQSTPGNLYKL
ncbi:MAG: glycosyltransferase family 2 protein [Rikenellaceae bacterium]